MNKQEIRDLIESYQKKKNVHVHIFHSTIGFNKIKQKDFKWFERKKEGDYSEGGCLILAHYPMIEATNYKHLFVCNHYDSDSRAVEWELILGKAYYILVIEESIEKWTSLRGSDCHLFSTKMLEVRSLKTGEVAKLNMSFVRETVTRNNVQSQQA
jgi:hypothetical protein